MKAAIRARLFAALAPALVPRPSPAAEPRHVLLIRPDHVGDVLLATPAITLARRAWPEARLTAMVGPWSQAALAGNPGLDEVLAFPFPGYEPTRRGPGLILARLLRAAWIVRRHRVDLGVTLRRDFWWGAALLALAGVRRRVGYAWPGCSPFLTEPLPVAREHEARLNLRLVRAARPAAPADDPPLLFQPSSADRANAELLLRGASQPLVAFNPGTRAAVKLWPAAHWIEVGRRLIEDHGATLVLTGSAEERNLCERIADELEWKCLVLAGSTSWGQLGAVLERCDLALGPDCGPLHLAVAVDTPSLALFGPTDPASFGPFGDPRRHRALATSWSCAPCGRLDYAEGELPEHACLASIRIEQVLMAAEALLARGRGAAEARPA